MYTPSTVHAWDHRGRVVLHARKRDAGDLQITALVHLPFARVVILSVCMMMRPFRDDDFNLSKW